MGFTQKSDLPPEPRIALPQDVEAGVQETKPIPTGHGKPPRKDSLSFEFSDAESTPRPTREEPKARKGLKDDVDGPDARDLRAVDVEQVEEMPQAPESIS